MAARPALQFRNRVGRPGTAAGDRVERRGSKAGIILRWSPEGPSAAIRLRRTLLNPSPVKKETGPVPPEAQPAEQNLLVEPESSQALHEAVDTNIGFGNVYEYRAQRLVHLELDGARVELDGDFSAPVRIEARDVFPPAVPQELAAVAVASDVSTGTQAAVDLSWRPDTEADLAGYFVYRCEGSSSWERISGSQPVVGPAFHDARVAPGRVYRYVVTAVDQGGHESGRSAEASDTVPNP